MKIWLVVLFSIGVAVFIYSIYGYLNRRKREKLRADMEFFKVRDSFYRTIGIEQGEDVLHIIKDIVDEDFSDTSEIGRSKIIEYLGFCTIKAKAETIIREHGEVLKRKKNQNLYKDEYGISNVSKWESERNYFVKKVLLPKLKQSCESDKRHESFRDSFLCWVDCHDDKEVIVFWERKVDDWINEATCFSNDLMTDFEDEEYLEYDDSMTGVEYEDYIEALAYNYGWEPTRTPATGDHGADVIITDGDIRIAIQCKKYSSPVGNKSVQEVYSAKDFYECDHAVVVTNSSFTTSARQVADSLNVRLVYHGDLQQTLESLSNDETDVFLKYINRTYPEVRDE
ncbi:restriction endonuclease [Halomonas sp. QHL1]|uniref:restriction endonuclease n=1 Tax=Halomonas sp. QHL1 TaxID=1123773 RepID=UPI000A9F59BC|nr:restriction endonuclease [Halomonas sp. QHL1]